MIIYLINLPIKEQGLPYDKTIDKINDKSFFYLTNKFRLSKNNSADNISGLLAITINNLTELSALPDSVLRTAEKRAEEESYRIIVISIQTFRYFQ